MSGKEINHTLRDLKETALFLVKCLDESSETKENEIEFLKKTITYLNSVVDSCFIKGDSRGLKNWISEIELWILHLPIYQIEQINRKLFSKFGKYIGEENFFKRLRKSLKEVRLKI